MEGLSTTTEATAGANVEEPPALRRSCRRARWCLILWQLWLLKLGQSPIGKTLYDVFPDLFWIGSAQTFCGGSSEVESWWVPIITSQFILDFAFQRHWDTLTHNLAQKPHIYASGEHLTHCPPCTSSSSTHPSSPPPRALGALPKRRSPRNISKNQSLKGKVDKPSSFVNFTSSASSFPPSQKRALFKYEPRQHLDGKETCDMVSFRSKIESDDPTISSGANVVRDEPEPRSKHSLSILWRVTTLRYSTGNNSLSPIW